MLLPGVDAFVSRSEGPGESYLAYQVKHVSPRHQHVVSRAAMMDFSLTSELAHFYMLLAGPSEVLRFQGASGELRVLELARVPAETLVAKVVAETARSRAARTSAVGLVQDSAPDAAASVLQRALRVLNRLVARRGTRHLDRQMIKAMWIVVKRKLDKARDVFAEEKESPGDAHSPDSRRSRAPNALRMIFDQDIRREVALA
jgi:hypothetical protein